MAGETVDRAIYRYAYMSLKSRRRSVSKSALLLLTATHAVLISHHVCIRYRLNSNAQVHTVAALASCSALKCTCMPINTIWGRMRYAPDLPQISV